jgi:hypothetical protein
MTSEHVIQDGRRVVIVEYEREADDDLTQKRVLSSRPLKDGEDDTKVLEEARGVVSDVAKEQLHDVSKEGVVLGVVNRC